MKLLSMGNSNHKIAKSDKKGEYLTAIQHFLPSDYSGVGNVCPFASIGCKTNCLNFAGLGRMNSVQKARFKKTSFYLQKEKEYKTKLHKEVTAFKKKCDKHKKKCAIRLNGFSDVYWVKKYPELFEEFDDIQWYDYTKIPEYYRRFLAGKLPDNVYLTFSRSEDNERQCLEFLKKGGNVAVVWRSQIPKEWKGYPVINADDDDLRFKDPQNVVCGLIAKGRAKLDDTGFVLD